MVTVTLSTARASLGDYARRALAGEEIGIILGPDILMLRPTRVTSLDYAMDEYGATPEEVAAAVRGAKAEIAEERKKGGLVSLSDLLKHGNPVHKKSARATRRPPRG